MRRFFDEARIGYEQLPMAIVHAFSLRTINMLTNDFTFNAKNRKIKLKGSGTQRRLESALQVGASPYRNTAQSKICDNGYTWDD